MNVFLNDPARRQAAMRSSESRYRLNKSFVYFCIATAGLSVVVLVVLLGTILWQSVAYLTPWFLTRLPSDVAEDSGIAPAIMGTLWVCVLCALFALPLGVATAILLEEFKPRQRLIRRLHSFVQININNLAGVPSVVYGILGMSAFAMMFGLCGNPKNPAWEIGVRYYDQFRTIGYTREDAEGVKRRVTKYIRVPVADRYAPSTQPYEGMQGLIDGRPTDLNVIPAGAAPPTDEQVLLLTLRDNASSGRIAEESWYAFRLPPGSAVVAGGLTLMLVVLPIVIIASQEAIRAVPNSLREAALGMGTTCWQMVWRVTLPAAAPGILTGSILAMSRAMGEAAPILIISGVVYIDYLPTNLLSGFTVMPLQIFSWAQHPKEEFHQVAAAGIVVLLGVLLSFNALAILLRQRWQRPLT
jgi:phosphate transport system permease protein